MPGGQGRRDSGLRGGSGCSSRGNSLPPPEPGGGSATWVPVPCSLSHCCLEPSHQGPRRTTCYSHLLPGSTLCRPAPCRPTACYPVPHGPGPSREGPCPTTCRPARVPTPSGAAQGQAARVSTPQRAAPHLPPWSTTCRHQCCAVHSRAISVVPHNMPPR